MSDESQIYYFANGIPGFEQLHRFVFEDLDEAVPIKLMKAAEEEVVLLVASPFLYYPEYEWELSEQVKDELQISSEDDVEIWSVMTVTEDSARATINLLAPIVLNVRQMMGKQLILHEYAYSSRAPINRE